MDKDEARAREVLAEHGCVAGFRPELPSGPTVVDPSAIVAAMLAFAAEARADQKERDARVADYQAECDLDHGFRDAAEHAHRLAAAIRNQDHD